MLGLIFDIDLEKMTEINYATKIDKIKNIINYWKRRNVSPLGKITIVKSLLLPLLTNIFTVLPSPPPKNTRHDK